MHETYATNKQNIATTRLGTLQHVLMISFVCAPYVLQMCNKLCVQLLHLSCSAILALHRNCCSAFVELCLLHCICCIALTSIFNCG